MTTVSKGQRTRRDTAKTVSKPCPTPGREGLDTEAHILDMGRVHVRPGDAGHCRERWGFKRNTAYLLIKESAAAKSVSGLIQTNREQARELARVEPEKREEVSTPPPRRDLPANAKETPLPATLADIDTTPRSNACDQFYDRRKT